MLYPQNEFLATPLAQALTHSLHTQAPRDGVTAGSPAQAAPDSGKVSTFVMHH